MKVFSSTTIALFAFAALAAFPALPAQGDERITPRSDDRTLPGNVAREVAERWNASDTRRVRGAFTLGLTDTLRGDLAVIGGPVRIAGVISGQLVIINADLTLEPSGRVTKDLTLVGGEVTGELPVSVAGEMRVWKARLIYQDEGERIAPVLSSDDEARWQRWRRDYEEQGAWGDIFAASAHTYNRVEGLPLVIGPRLRTNHGDTRATVELFGIFRTGNELSWEGANLGHRLRGEVRQGRNSGFAIGGKLYDEVTPVERWALSDDEVGLASVLFTRDFRDYYQRHGGSGYATVFGPAQTSLTLSVGEERWGSRAARNPWSVFGSNDLWRANPRADHGLIQLVTVTGRLDTRNDDDRPRSGWLLSAEYERGSGTLTQIAPTTLGTRTTAPGDITYARALLDLRRYNRLAPNTQLNVRVVAGGVLAGDPLPAQRRFSVSGADALPGYDFRSKTGPTDVGTCASGSDSLYSALGRPAQCDRVLLVQAEWKSDFHFSLFGNDDAGWGLLNHRIRADGTWVVFMDSGRGWLIGDGESALHYGISSLPALDTWRTDVGAGLDFGSFGVYIAQSISDTNLKPNVFIRLGRRF
ncbi:MAG: hypothetical protein H7Z40_12200 [Phycisphaerae bacterium]|nr:hypothetical protein [Gemmatimonadaceae bacterium]